jgi:hypothetical protein
VEDANHILYALFTHTLYPIHCRVSHIGGAVSAASSFFLPLDRVLRALRLIQQSQPISRGTLQTVFKYTPFDEVKRLGLQADIEAAVRQLNPENTGMLVVR